MYTDVFTITCLRNEEKKLKGVQRVNLYTAYRAQALTWVAFVVQVRIDRKG